MSEPRSSPGRPLPRWLAFVVGVAVAGHFAAVGLLVLAASSGPWPTPYGSSRADGPAFARSAGNFVTRNYLSPLRMTHNYHFASNLPGQPDAFFEVRLKNEAGEVVRTLRFPDEKAPRVVRHRQAILARRLADDQPVQPRAGEAIPAPNQSVRHVEIWDTTPDGYLALRSVPEHLVPRDRMVFRPSEWSLTLARSYIRHLCRVHGAVSGELLRHTREAVVPAMLYVEDPPADSFFELVTHFGEMKK